MLGIDVDEVQTLINRGMGDARAVAEKLDSRLSKIEERIEELFIEVKTLTSHNTENKD